MTDFQYGNRSINSLVQQLNNLGNRSVAIHQTELMAVQTGQNRNIRRFQSKSSPRSQFFKFNQNDRKYVYNTVFSQLDQTSLTQFMKNWQKGYNCTVLIQNSNQQFQTLINAISQWTKGCLIFCVVLDQQNQLFDLLGQSSLTHRQLLENKKYYQIDDSNKNKILIQYLESLFKNPKFTPESTMIDITLKNPTSCSELHLTLLPSQIFKSDCNPPFSLIKTQLIRLLNYIKMNPNKRYQHISKLITKRLPMTNYLTKILMSDSCNLLINFIESEDYQQTESIGKFQFFDKISLVSNLLRKADRHIVEIAVLKPLRRSDSSNNKQHPNLMGLTRSHQSKSNKQNNSNQIVSSIERLNLKTQNEIDRQDSDVRQKQEYLQQRQFQFCRSLQRKTHKYSISPRQQSLSHRSKQLQFKNKTAQSNIHTFLDKKTISKYDPDLHQNQFNGIQIESQKNHITTLKSYYLVGKSERSQPVSQSQQITLLKAQYTREISQYHQTIQLLNKKIMILTKQLNLDELYKIHQREIMLLELKIQQLRQQVVLLTKDEPDQKSTKSIIKRLTEQIKSYQNTSTIKKLSQGRLLMLQKDLNNTKQKLSVSQKARSTLTLEIDALTKRLKIRDSQIQKINQEDIEKYKCQNVSTTQEQIFEDIKKLVRTVKDQQRNSVQFLLRKISFILSDLSKSRDVILECNDFLVQLMEILEAKLSKKMPQIVLDCNKFIRSFLMENLAIF